MAEQRTEIDKSLDEIRKEVIEGRNLIIKTDNLLKSLHAELKALSKRQEDVAKRQWVASAVAYALFAGLCAAGALLLSSARTATADTERARLEKQVRELTESQEKSRAEQAAQAAAAQKAGEVYRLMTNLPGDERLKGIDALVKLDTGRLSGLEKRALDDRAELLRKEIGLSAYERGKQAFRRNEFGPAVSDLGRFLAMNPPTDEALDASFFLGAALAQQRKYAEAVPPLQRFVTGDKRSKQRDYAMMLLAQSYELSNQPEKAVEVARDALGAYPASDFSAQFKVRLGAVRRAQAAAGGGTQGGAAPATPPGAAPAAPPAAPNAPPAAPPPGTP